MEDGEDASERLLREKIKPNTTEISRSRQRTRQDSVPTTNTPLTSTNFPHYYDIPRRPKVIKMRDLSEATKSRLFKEYFEAYDPWTGVRIAATLGILISLFTLFLIYKSKYNKTKNNIVASKKTSLYLYDEDLECDLEHIAASDDTGSFAYPSYRYGDRIPVDYHFGLNNQDYPLEEVFVKSSMAECVALTVHNKNSKGPKYGTLRITEPSHSLPCSPYKKNIGPAPQEETVYTAAKSPFSSTPPLECSSSLSGSITSFGSSDFNDRLLKTNLPINSREQLGASRNAIEAIGKDVPPDNQGTGLAKRPQDYRSRSTVVTIGRRKRKS